MSRLLSSKSLVLVLSWGLSLVTASAFAEVTAEKTEAGVDIKIGGKPFTTYLTNSNRKPILWPVLGPKGERLTRSYPLEKVEGETTDHIHQRSLWFTHGSVNGVSFWEETTKNAGRIVHREFVEVKSGPEAVVTTRNDWLGPDDKKHCEDQRRFVFGTMGDNRFIDVEIAVKATVGDVEFGDTKEGSFGVRVADSIKVDAKKGGKIVNSDGKTDAAAWGQPAAWVDYHGPIDGHTAGIAILNHPSSFRFPTTWHVRTYGLFAANPFGAKDFTKGAAPSGAHTIKNGDKMTLRYRVLLHEGDEKEAKIAEAFAEYSKLK